MPDLPPGIALFFQDAGAFLASVQFQRPLLWLFGFMPLVFKLCQRIRLNCTTTLIATNTLTPRNKRIVAVSHTFGWLALAGALAGPTWGRGEKAGVSVGRDVVVVLDFSRSMLADDTTTGQARWQLAVASAQDLINTLKTKGHRVGVVVFAARPMVVVPLTTDPAFAEEKLASLDGRYLPAEIRPADDTAPSGTRIGAAIQLALTLHDERFLNVQDIVLLSDGDDPAKEDDTTKVYEWRQGIAAARKAKVPVHTVGFGDAERESTIMVNGDFLKLETKPGVEEIAQTKLRESVLQAIALETQGHYVKAGRSVANLGEFFRTQIEPLGTRELTDDQVPQKVPRGHWFALFALVMFVLCWVKSRTGLVPA